MQAVPLASSSLDVSNPLVTLSCSSMRDAATATQSVITFTATLASPRATPERATCLALFAVHAAALSATVTAAQCIARSVNISNFESINMHHQAQTSVSEYDLRRTYARHWRASWGPTFADAMTRPRAVREMTEKAQETPAIMRRPVSVL